MYTVMGVSGQVGADVARALLDGNQRVRVVVRDAEKGHVWATQGCEVAVADANDVNALTRAFNASTGAFILLPPNFDPSEGFPETRIIVENLRTALQHANPKRGAWG